MKDTSGGFDSHAVLAMGQVFCDWCGIPCEVCQNLVRGDDPWNKQGKEPAGRRNRCEMPAQFWLAHKVFRIQAKGEVGFQEENGKGEAQCPWKQEQQQNSQQHRHAAQKIAQQTDRAHPGNAVGDGITADLAKSLAKAVPRRVHRLRFRNKGGACDLRNF